MDEEEPKSIPRPVWERFGPRRKSSEPEKIAVAVQKQKGPFSNHLPAIFKVQMEPALFERMVAIAERMEVRKVGVPLWKQGKKLKADKMVANTKSMPKAMQKAMLYWEADEVYRKAREADFARRQAALDEEKKRGF